MLEPAGGHGPRTPPVNPQLALRIAIFGAVAFGLFALIFLRLWFLQVLSGDRYRQEAMDNRVRTVAIAAPRGSIVDRNGRPLVENRVATVLQLDPRSLPEQARSNAARWGQLMGRRSLRPKGRRGAPVPIPPPATPELAVRYRRLGAVLGMSAAEINRRVTQQLAMVPYANVRLKVDVPASMRDFLLERQMRFPGIAVEQVYLRRYPLGATAAQLVGTTGEVSPAQLETKDFSDVRPGTIVGKEGIERAYDRFLRGASGTQSITVDAAGRPKSQRLAREPRAGLSLRTSLDLGLQRTGQQQLDSVIAGGPGTAGAFVALDPRDGEVLAMGSSPTFDPNVLARPISQARYDELFVRDQAGAPRFNRAIGGAYPTGSTFKPITALAALDRGLVTPETPVEDTGVFKLGKQQFKNAQDAVYGTIDMRRALQVSSDVYFYKLGAQANGLRGQAIQSWARKLGLGRPTGIDVPGEAAGTIPDRAWRAAQNRKEKRWEKKTGKRCPPDCLYSDGRPWSVGDNVNLAVGQGDVQASPLQMAVAYAAIANGGQVVRPHLGTAIEDEGGSEIQRLPVPAARRVGIDAGDRRAVLDGLHLSTTAAGGTSADVFAGWPQRRLPVYGKTGTAERQPHGDQSWYIAYVPHPARPIVVAVTVEQGGFGAEAAAPVACRMLRRWFEVKAQCAPGASRTQ